MRRLVESWIAAERQYYGLSLAAAIKKLNAVVGINVRHSRVSQWRRGVYTPAPAVVSQMLYRTLPWALERGGLSVTTEQQKEIDRQLWDFEGKEGEVIRKLL